MIPNYRLMACLNASPELQSINKLTLRDSIRCARLKLWDEAERRLIAYRSREGGAFAFSDELSDKRRQLCEIEKSLSQAMDGTPSSEVRAA